MSHGNARDRSLNVVPHRSLEALARLRGRLRRLYLIDSAARIILLVGLAAVLSFTLDYLLHLPVQVRFVLILLGAFALFGFIRRRLLAPLSRPVSDEDLALLVEDVNPDLKQQLITAIQLSRPESEGGRYVSPGLLASIVDDVESSIPEIGFERIFKLGRLRRNLVGLAALLAVIVSFAAASPEYFSIWFGRNLLLGAQRWPKATMLEMEPGTPSIVAIGDSLPVAVRVLRGRPKAASVESQHAGGRSRHHAMDFKEKASWDVVLVDPGDERERLRDVLSRRGRLGDLGRDALDAGAGRLARSLREQDAEALTKDLRDVGAVVTLEGFDVFYHEFKNISEPLEFRVEGGDDRTDWHLVEVRLRPRIDMKSIDIAYTLPRYTGKSDAVVEQKHGNLRVPEGTLVNYRMATNVPVERAFFVLRQGGEEAETRALPAPTAAVTAWPEPGAEELALEGGTNFGGRFTVLSDGHYFFQFEDANGLRSVKPQKFRIQAITDRKPLVRIVEPSRMTEDVSVDAEVRVKITLKDDYPIRRGVLEGLYYPPESTQDNARSVPIAQSIELPGVAAETPSVGRSEHEVEILLKVAELKTAPATANDERAADDASEPSSGASSGGVQPGARFEFFALAEDFAQNGDDKRGNIGQSEVHTLQIVGKDLLESQLTDQLMVVRDQLEQLMHRQQAARKELQTFQKDMRLRGELPPAEAHKLSRYRQDQQRIREGLERQAREMARIVDKMEANKLKDEKWKRWVEERGDEVREIADTKSGKVESDLDGLRREATAKAQEPNRISPIVAAQRQIEHDVQAVVMKLTEFGDYDALLQILRHVRRRQSELRNETREQVD